METLKKKYTVVIVTHNMQQAARVSDDTAFFLVGKWSRKMQPPRSLQDLRINGQKTTSPDGLVDFE